MSHEYTLNTFCLLLSLVITSTACPTTATAGIQQLTTLTFDEVPFQSVDGLTVQEVTFEFKVAGINSSEAFYNSFGPGTTDTIDDPSLTGDSSGVLGFDFALPTTILEFGVALNTNDALEPGVFVQLFNAAGDPTDAIPVNTMTSSVLGFSEALFQYAGAPVSRAELRFAAGPDSFAIDNMTYAVPEPATLWLAFLPLGVALVRRSRNVARRR